ncbi:MAG: hypothetical protein WCW61_02420 [Patescibacteria group bacterium]
MPNIQETPNSQEEGVIKKTKSVFLSPVKSKGVLASVGVVLIFLIALIFVNYFSLMKTRQELQNYSAITANLENELKTISKRSTLVSSWRSFGDNFSSYAYISKEETDMFFDERVTAFNFPPVYNFDSVSGCEDSACGLKSSSLVATDQDGGQQISKVPAELKDKKIIFSQLNKLNSLQVASFIVTDGPEERAYVYFYDGKKFTPIITENTENQIITKYSRGGGAIVAGGDDKDFIILYIGYEGLGFHYKNGQLKNISDFFGLRVADNGFKPYIVKEGKDNNAVWYVLSLNSNKPKLIKLWQNNTSEIVGAVDLSNVFDASEGSLAAFAPGDKMQEIKFIFKKDGSTNVNAPAQILIPGASSQTEVQIPASLSPYELRLFSDKGFDNTIDRSVVSVNLNEAQGNVTKAKINEIGVNGEAKLFLSNSDKIFFETKENEEIVFTLHGRDLFWRADFQKGDSNQYSPWFDNINYLDYYLQVD